MVVGFFAQNWRELAYNPLGYEVELRHIEIGLGERRMGFRGAEPMRHQPGRSEQAAVAI